MGYMQQILSYDESLESGKSLAVALKTNLFNIYASDDISDSKDDEIIKEEHVALMVNYVQTSLKQLSKPSVCIPIEGMKSVPQFLLNPTLHGVLNFASLPPPPVSSSSSSS
eukprot:c35015_g1_i1.p1 GENE.c35015_g1_i1~~c35015_g1_i1.p1  ORF type:complete len:111 (-),score=4.71 c35015_g1_i1:19-351(-)